MRFLFKLVLLLVFTVFLTTAWALYLAIDREPTLRRAAEITPANIKRAKQVLDGNDLRGLRTGNRRSVTVSEQDLDLAANYLAHFYADGSARLSLKDGKAEVTASLRPPRIPVIFYFNVSAVLTEGSPLPQFEQLRVGRLSIPGFMANWVVARVIGQLLGKDRLDAAAPMIKRMELRSGHLAVAYEWPSNQRFKLPGAIFSPDDQERLRAYQERLALISKGAKVRAISLTELLVALFELADIRSAQDDAVAENRAALLVLAFYVTGKPLGTIVPVANGWPRAMEQIVTLNGRNDFSKHFIVSAALAANAGTALADAVGDYKEIADRLAISMSTIRTHVGAIYEKLHVHSRTEAAMKLAGREAVGPLRP